MSNQKPVIRPLLASDYAVQTAEPRDLFFYGNAHIIDRVRENLSAFKTVLGDLDLLRGGDKLKILTYALLIPTDETPTDA
jgi:hypothetical protein